MDKIDLTKLQEINNFVTLKLTNIDFLALYQSLLSAHYSVWIRIALSLFLIYLLCTKFFRLGKIAFIVIYSAAVFEIYKAEEITANVVWLFAIWILLVLSIRADFLAAKIRKNWDKDSVATTYLLKNIRKFNIYFLIFLVVYEYIHINFNEYDAYFAFAFMIFLNIYYTRAKFISNTIVVTKKWAMGIDSKSYALVGSVFDTFEEKDRQNRLEILKAIVDETLQELSNRNLINLRTLGANQYIFGEIYFKNLIEHTESIAKSGDRISVKNALGKLKDFIEVDEMGLEDIFMLTGNVNKYVFDTTEYFVHNYHLDKYIFCECCGIGEYRNDHKDSVGAWYCSAICKNTEIECLALSEALNPTKKAEESKDEYEKRANIQAQNFADMINSKDNENESNGRIVLKLALQEITKQYADIINDKYYGDYTLVKKAESSEENIQFESIYFQYPEQRFYKLYDEEMNLFKYNGEHIEIPKEQYEVFLKLIKNAIESSSLEINGEIVPSDMDEKTIARDMLSVGNFSFNEVKLECKFALKHSLLYNAKEGYITTNAKGGISFVMENALINLANSKADSINQHSLKNKTAPIKKAKASEPKSDLEQVGDVLKKQAKKQITKGITQQFESKLVSGGVKVMLNSSTEIMQTMRGKMSGMQCIKNIAINAGGVAGGKIGMVAGAAALSFIPVVGTMAGGMIGAKLGNMLGKMFVQEATKFIEDDITKKYRIFYGHMTHLAIFFKLSNEEMSEFSDMVDSMISSDDDFFGDDFSVSEMLPYANSILKPLVIMIISNREKIAS